MSHMTVFITPQNHWGVILDYPDCGLCITGKACIHLPWKYISYVYTIWIRVK